MKITMEEIAKEAGVSKATVSRVLNHIPGAASKETTEKIWKIVEENNYVADQRAASLKTGVSMSVGLIVPDIGNPFFARVIDGVEKRLQEDGYSLVIANTGNLPNNEILQVQKLVGQKVDALIIATCSPDGNQLMRVKEKNIQIVLFDNMLPNVDLDCVVVDNRGASFTAIRHLIELGHRRIATVGGSLATSTGRERMEGYRQALEQESIEIDPQYMREGDFRVDSGYRETKELLALEKRPTAIFVANNLMTIGALKAIKEMGLQIPNDISVVGFDDMDWYSIANPPLTSICQPAADIGRVAADRLVKRLNRKRQPATKRIVLKTDFVVRDSTQEPPGMD